VKRLKRSVDTRDCFTLSVRDVSSFRGSPSAQRNAETPFYFPTGMYEGSSRKAIEAFKAVLDRARVPATVRLTRGRDIAAACGQLAAAS
jgi:hypothetical protein